MAIAIEAIRQTTRIAIPTFQSIGTEGTLAGAVNLN